MVMAGIIEELPPSDDHVDQRFDPSDNALAQTPLSVPLTTTKRVDP